MTFSIYTVAAADNEPTTVELSEDDVVESGLSAGEVRQALLDRFRQETHTEDLYFINFTLANFELEFDEDLIETDEGRASILTDIENLLYDTDDEALESIFWEFHNEIVCVRSDG